MPAPLPFAPSAQTIRAAAARRAHLPAEGTTFYRLLHTTETAGRCSLDRAGNVGILSLYTGQGGTEEAELLETLEPLLPELGLASVYLKRRPREASKRANVQRGWLAPAAPVLGPACPELTVTEAGVPFLIRPSGGQNGSGDRDRDGDAGDLSVGLFADARPMRGWVQAHAGGLRVLNLFAYTCGFGLSAALGGAVTVKNVDLSRKVLQWGQENYALSGLAAPDTDFLYGDCFQWLSRLAKRGGSFDLVVLDPPSFARRGRKVWRAERDYAALVTSALEVLDTGGRILTMTNHAGLSAAKFDRLVAAGFASAGRAGQRVQTLEHGPDFPRATHLAAAVWQADG